MGRAGLGALCGSLSSALEHVCEVRAASCCVSRTGPRVVGGDPLVSEGARASGSPQSSCSRAPVLGAFALRVSPYTTLNPNSSLPQAFPIAPLFLSNLGRLSPPGSQGHRLRDCDPGQGGGPCRRRSGLWNWGAGAACGSAGGCAVQQGDACCVACCVY